MNTPVLIAQIEPPQALGSGDFYYRTYAPSLAMAEEEGIYAVNLTSEHRLREEIALNADILILKNICDPDFLPCIEKRTRRNRPTFYEIADDFSAVPAWNPIYFFCRNIENQRLFQRLARSCRGLQFTCKRLQDVYGYLNANCRVFPNQILELPEERIIKNKKQIIIGWGGSHGHMEDLAAVAEDLMVWIDRHPNVSLHLMCSDPIWNLFDALPVSRKKRTIPGTITDYYKFLSQIDIGLIPLKNTNYNRARSDVKFLEYAAAGVAAVIQKIDPYEESVRHGENALFFENPAQMINCLDTLYNDWDAVKKITTASRMYVSQNRMQKKHIKARLEFYDFGFHHTTDTNHAQEYFAKWSHVEGASIKGRHLQLCPSRYELLLHDSLVAMQIDKNQSLAHRLLEEAKKIEPMNYLPYLFDAKVSPEPMISLYKALTLKPDSLKAWIMLGEHYDGCSRAVEAIQSFETAVKLYPEYEIPFLRAGHVLDHIGRKTDAQKLYSKAAELTALLERNQAPELPQVFV